MDKRTYSSPCGLCDKQIESVDDLDWHGLGNCVPICPTCNGSGTSQLEPSPCTVPGHEGQWVEDKDSLSHLDGNYQEQIKKGMFNEYQVDSLRQDNSYCRACLREKQIETKVWNEALSLFYADRLGRECELNATIFKSAMRARSIPVTPGTGTRQE